MYIHESVFWGIVFFLIGIFLAPSIGLTPMAAIFLVSGMCGAAFAWRVKHRRMLWLSALMLLGIVGGIYWNGYNVYRKGLVDGLIGRDVVVTGHVINVRRSEKTQRVSVELDSPNKGVVSMMARSYPIMEYGDVITAKGVVRRPDRRDGAYLAKDAIFATMTFPEIKVVRREDGNPLMMRLLGIKQAAVARYKRLLPTDEAALLAGITLGERAEFSKKFKEQMANSGTTHLVALSGYNISVVAGAVLFLCASMMRRTFAFYATVGVIIGFVIMAGAEASVVRAAIMGSIVLLAGHIGRSHSMRNAIAISACAMVLWNPNVLRYDLGFQLSFLALIGIVYVKPHMDRIIKRKKNGFMDWRENLSGTVSAQLMVFPLLMQGVGSFSAVSLLSNIVILAFIPATMGLGFAIAALGFIAQPLAQVPAWIASLLLKYEIAMIGLFGAQKGFSIPMTAAWVAVYYVIMGWVLMKLHKKERSNRYEDAY